MVRCRRRRHWHVCCFGLLSRDVAHTVPSTSIPLENRLRPSQHFRICGPGGAQLKSAGRGGPSVLIPYSACCNMCLLHPPVAHDLRTSDTNNLYDLRKKFRPPRVLTPRIQCRASLSRFASHRTTTTKASRWSTPSMKTTAKERRVTTPDTDTRRQQQYLWPPSLDDRVPRRDLAGLVATRTTRPALIGLC
jgi:hypothetical protein